MAAMPSVPPRAGPQTQSRTPGHQPAHFHNLAVGHLDAELDVFLVYVESDIVSDVHGVLQFEDSEPALHRGLGMVVLGRTLFTQLIHSNRWDVFFRAEVAVC